MTEEKPCSNEKRVSSEGGADGIGLRNCVCVKDPYISVMYAARPSLHAIHVALKWNIIVTLSPEDLTL